MDRITARCASYEQTTPYALIADFLRGAFGIHAANEEIAARTAFQAGLARYGYAPDPIVVPVILEIIGYPAHSALDPERTTPPLVTVLPAILQGTAERAPVL